jgi:hypothetical protein
VATVAIVAGEDRRKMRGLRGLLICVLALGAWAAPAGASGVSAQDLNQAGVTPQALVTAIVGSGVSVSNVAYTGSNCGGGIFSGGAGSIGIATGAVLGTGSVQSGDASCDGAKGIEGPNGSTSNSGNNNTPGDTQLSQLAGQTANPPQASAPTFDAAILQFDFVPTGSTLSFNYVFSSDEYNEFVHTEFNDVFAFFVNGTNCALVPGTNLPVTINSVNGGNPFGTNANNPQFYRNNDAQPGPLDTEVDGLTTVFTCQANVNPGVTNHIKLAIADTSDSIYDSNVFLQGGSFSAPPPTTTTTTTTTTTPGGGGTGTTTTSTTTPGGGGTGTTTTTTKPGGSTTTTVAVTQSTGAVSPSSGAPGQVVAVSGGGFAPNQPLQVTYSDPPTSLGTAVSDPGGNFSIQVTIPANAAAGQGRIIVSGPAPRGGTHQVIATVTVAGSSLVATPVAATPTFTG